LRDPEDGQDHSLPSKPDLEPPFAALRRELQPRRNEMHPEEVMKADLLSEIVLVTFGALTLSSLLLFVAALARS
jgi:hypothetical protein